MELIREIETMFENQLMDWDLARENYAGLQNTRVRMISYEGFEILVQFNPKRIISSSARIDPQSISARPCFLCEKNRPAEQQGIPFQNNHELLVNPFPVFPGHLTIPATGHEPQRILPNFGLMLEIAGSLPQYTVIYNGPQCGASAPDHFHFQAVRKGHMPVEKDFLSSNKCMKVREVYGTGVYTWNNYLRKLITLQGNEPEHLEALFTRIYRLLKNDIPSEEEPMMNILAGYDKEQFVIHLIPRKLHRPDRYFASGEDQLLLSPASIDMGGVLIMPREEDFNKISREDIKDVFRQVCVEDETIQYLVNQLN
jgi:hypothetical protein